jgi:hypothetical protein
VTALIGEESRGEGGSCGAGGGLLNIGAATLALSVLLRCSFGAPSVVLRWCFGGDRSSSGAAALDQRSNTLRNSVSVRVYRHKRLKAAPDLYAPYKLQAQIVPRRACELEIADFLNPPVVDDIDVSKYAGAPGQLICSLVSPKQPAAMEELADFDNVNDQACARFRSLFLRCICSLGGRFLLINLLMRSSARSRSRARNAGTYNGHTVGSAATDSH